MLKPPPLQLLLILTLLCIGWCSGKRSGGSGGDGSPLQTQHFTLTQKGVANCFDHWRLLRFLMPQNEVFVDIGANKGYVSVGYFNLWNTKHNLTPQSWWQCIIEQKEKEKEKINHCGMCNDCKEVYDSSPSIEDLAMLYNSTSLIPLLTQYQQQHLNKEHATNILPESSPERKIIVYSFDGQYVLRNQHQRQLQKCFPNLIPFWHWETLAFSNQSGETSFFQGDGWEKAGIREGKGGKMTKKVEMISLDIWRYKQKHMHMQKLKLKQNQIQIKQSDGRNSVSASSSGFIIDSDKMNNNIDILKIDVEGYDALVLQGAKKTLQKHVKVVVFEVSNRGNWMETFLSDVVRMMYEYGLVCYMTMADSLLLRLTEMMTEFKSEAIAVNTKLKNNNKNKNKKKSDDLKNQVDKPLPPYTVSAPLKAIGWGNVICAHTKLAGSIVSLFDEISEIEVRRLMDIADGNGKASSTTSTIKKNKEEEKKKSLFAYLSW